MSVHADIFEQRTTAHDKLQHRIEPFVIAQQLHRLHGEHLGRKANAVNMLDVEQRVAKRAHMCGLESREIAARDDDIVDLWMGANVIESGLPVLRTYHVIVHDELSVLADGKAS